MHKRKAKSEKGFSIIELLLVIMIVGFIALMVTNIPSSLRLIGKSKYESIAREIATQRIEDLRNTTYTGLANTGGAPNPITDSRLSRLPSGKGEIFIEDCPITICTNNEVIKKIIVKVSWSESGQIKDVQFTTLISQGGLQ